MAESMRSPSDHELDRTLSELAGRLAYPPTPDLASSVRRRLANQPAHRRPFASLLQRRLAVALLIVIAAAGTILAASPEARTAIAERLGLRGVQIQQVPALPPETPAGAGLNLGQPTTLEQVRGRVSYPVLLPTELGTPDDVYLLDAPAGGQVALVYHPRADLPQAHASGVGLLLTEFLGSVHTPPLAIGKGLPPGTSLEDIQVNAGRGYWIDGDPHLFFYLDARGQVQTETTRLAGSVLLWEQGQLTLRLESALSKDAALHIAASVE